MSIFSLGFSFDSPPPEKVDSWPVGFSLTPVKVSILSPRIFLRSRPENVDSWPAQLINARRRLLKIV